MIFSFIVGGVGRHEIAEASETGFWGVFIEVRGEKNGTGAGPICTIFLTIFRSSAVGFDNVEFRLRRDRRRSWGR